MISINLPDTFFLYKSAILVVATVLLGVVFLINANTAIKFLDKKFSEKADWLVAQFDSLFIEINKKTAIVLLYASSLGVAFIVFVLSLPDNVMAGLIIGTSLGFMTSRLPEPFIEMLKTKRAATFNLQMVDALTLMSNGLRSGLNLLQAVELVVNEMPSPIRDEFSLILAQNRVGVPLDEAFLNISKRLDLEDLNMFSTAILILRETGGNLAETFDTIAYTIRERVKLTAKIKALTAQGIMQAIVISVIPFVLLVIQYLANPAKVRLMFTTPVGYMLLGAMFMLQGIGGFMIKKIVSIKV